MPFVISDNSWGLTAAALLVVLLALVITLLIISVRQRRQSEKALNTIRAEMCERLDATNDTLRQAGLEQREGLMRNLNQLGDSLFNMISAVTRQQGEQVNALLKQNYDNAQAFDQRQQGMQRITEESLSRIEARMHVVETNTAGQLAQNEQRIEAMRKVLDDSMRLMRTENAQKLDEMRSTVDEKLQSTLEKRLSDSFMQVSKQLEQVYQSLGEMHSLADGVGDLKRILGNVKTRGVWGEIQLNALLEQALTASQYDRNVAIAPGSAERVEFAVKLPGQDGERPVYLPIDSKFPQEDYARLTDAAQSGDPIATENARKALIAAIKTEARRIGKYILPPYSTDFAVMFLPLEGLYAEVARNADTVAQIQREQRVLISGPSTLLALLNSLQMGFRTLAIEQRSAEVWKLLGAVKTDFGTFTKVLQTTQEKLKQATDSIDSAFVKTRNIERRLKDVELIELHTPTPETIELTEDTHKSIPRKSRFQHES